MDTIATQESWTGYMNRLSHSNGASTHLHLQLAHARLTVMALPALPKQRLALLAKTLPLAYTELGPTSDLAVLLLHGGAGTNSVMGFAHALAKTYRVIVPTHPGFDGESRPESCYRIADLAWAYLALIEKLELSKVLVVGSSMGGWIAAEIALHQSPCVAGFVLINAAGVEPSSPDQTIVDPSKLPPSERVAMVFHDPVKFAPPPPPPEARKLMAGNQQALQAYMGGPLMYDPKLKPRLDQITIPCMVVWGESDRIIPSAYGRAFAKHIPNAQFALVKQAGHLPHIEQPDEVMRLFEEFKAKCG